VATIKHDPRCRCVICVAAAIQHKQSVGTDLTKRQKKAAATLRAKRPMCLPGTDKIIRESEAADWHDLVTKAAIDLKLEPQQVPAFCDAAGVSNA
jgi:hypothetical protein